MRFRGLFLSVAVLVLAMFSAIGTGSSGEAAPGPAGQEQYVVVLVAGADSHGAARAAERAQGVQVLFEYEHALKGFAFRGSSQAAQALARDPQVQFVSEDREVHTTDQSLPTGVQRIGGASSSTASGNGSGAVNVNVAIIDTGIDVAHPDLNVVGGKNCSTGKSYSDGNGHGTHVAGTVAARDDSTGVVGVAPGARLYAVRVLNNAGSGTWSSVICGIDWVTQNAATIKVANMSLGGSGADDGNCGNTNRDALHKAICGSTAAGVTYVVAAGNDGKDLKGFVPAAYDETITVTAIADFNGASGGGAASTCRSDVDDTAADFSNWATPGSADAAHTIAAPGVCIRSTWKGGGYSTISGTSMASPHVTGTVALCISSGACTGSAANIRSKLLTDAANRVTAVPSYGFTGVGDRYYGNLVYTGGY